MISFYTYVEVPILVEAWIQKAEKQTRDHPGCDECVDDMRIKLKGDLDDIVDMDALAEEAMEKYAAEADEREIARAEQMWEDQKDRASYQF